MAVPFSFDDTMRVHDKAVYDWLGTLLLDYGEIAGAKRNAFPILRVFASPQRAFAQVPDLLASLGWIDGVTATQLKANASRDFAVLPLPVASITRSDPALDGELGSVPKVFRRRFLNPKTRKWEFHQWPGHYKTDYLINFWTVKRFSEAFIREWIYGQLGKVGAGEWETFIPVTHKPPWNTFQQSFKFTGSADLSDLEGEETRYMRHEFSFTLRTWVHKTPTFLPALPSIAGVGVTPDFIERIGLDAQAFGVQHGRLDEGAEDLDIADLDRQTGNLFFFPFNKEDTPNLWPKAGKATIKYGIISPRGDRFRPFHNTLKIGVAEQPDTVELAERLVELDTDDLALVGVSFEYVADEDVELEIKQREVATDDVTSANSLILTKTRPWKRVHRFTVLNKDTLIAQVAGIGGPLAPQTAHLHNIDIRAISSLTKIPPTSTIVGGSETTHTWNGLANAPHLVILILTSTIGGPNQVTVEDDDTSPAHTLVQAVDAAVNVGSVFLAQPVSDSLVAKVPNDVTIARIYAQRYFGAYNGHDFTG